MEVQMYVLSTRQCHRYCVTYTAVCYHQGWLLPGPWRDQRPGRGTSNNLQWVWGAQHSTHNWTIGVMKAQSVSHNCTRSHPGEATPRASEVAPEAM